ncbi:hypothetical protein MGN01_19100 [Methylobacterium gnaphalii]|uniref:DUF4136 domain-containing protein n=2 Tax=Methylobacterium gnaphalii TaxID=1010610 RepID=A0A512JJC3_9HYPH|nr:hypothetical protein MGN01_19100 [Methylobacterium gnaphalii]GLS48335.1 hypothetical protein GCM10007885_11790 [Methylobacterium gnaphalii]
MRPITIAVRTVGGIAAAALLCLMLAQASVTQAASGFGRFASVRVDVRPFLAEGGGAQAEALRADLTLALRQAFAGRIGGRGPSLVVVVRSLSLNAYAGSGNSGRGGRGGGGGSNDYLDGEALLVGANGQVLARHPQLAVLPASSGGAWYDPASERRRIAAIAEQYAQWLVRTLPAE